MWLSPDRGRIVAEHFFPRHFGAHPAVWAVSDSHWATANVEAALLPRYHAQPPARGESWTAGNRLNRAFCCRQATLMQASAVMDKLFLQSRFRTSKSVASPCKPTA